MKIEPFITIAVMLILFGCVPNVDYAQQEHQNKKTYHSYIAQGDGDNVRNTEGDIIQLDNGDLYCAYTKFKDNGADNAYAEIAAKISVDSGATWIDRGVIVPNNSLKNNISASLLRVCLKIFDIKY